MAEVNKDTELNLNAELASAVRRHSDALKACNDEENPTTIKELKAVRKALGEIGRRFEAL